MLSVKTELRSQETLGPFAGSIQPRYSTDYSFRVFGRMVSRPVNIGSIVGPIQVDNTWHLVRVEDRRERGVPSLETLRPRIVDWLRFQEITRLQERLERDARIERLREPDQSMPPTSDMGPASMRNCSRMSW